MRKIINCAVFTFLILMGCNKDGTDDGLYNGRATALKNGSAFEARVRFSKVTTPPGLGLLRLHLDVYNQQGFWRESLSIAKLDNLFTVQKIVSNGFDGIDGPKSNYSTLTDDGDVIGDVYDQLDLQNNNYFKFTRYNSGNGEIEGEFNISLVLTRDNGEGEVPPDTLRFTQGRFSAKAERSWFE